MPPVIYKIECTKTKKIYIGSSVRHKGRWAMHLHNLRKGKHHSIHLQRSYNKHGEDSFVFSVIEETTKEDILKREQHWIDEHKGRLYNVYMTAGSCLGVKRSEAWCKRQGRRMKGNRIKRGTKSLPETKQKISATLVGNQRRKGIPHSPEVKARIKASMEKAHAEGKHTGAGGFHERRAYGNDWGKKNKGKPKSEEHKKKQSEIMKKKHLDKKEKENEHTSV